MIRLFKSAAGILWAGLLGLVILAGVLSATAQLVAPFLGGLRDDLEHHLGQALRAPVRIERLAIRWRGLGPELVASNVAVLEMGGRAGLEVGEILVSLSLADALRHGRLWPTRIGVAGVRLKLIRQANGSLAIEGLRPFPADDAAGIGDGGDRLAALLVPEHLRIADAEIVVEDRMRGRPPMTFRNGVLLVHNDGPRHQITAALDLPDERGTRLSFAADLYAEADRLEDWRGEIYFDTAGAQVAPLVAPFLPPHYRLDQATAQARVWIGWEGGEPTWAEGRATVSELQLRGLEPARSLHLDRLDGRFRWDRQRDGWVLRTTDVAVGPATARAGGAELALAWRRAGTHPAGLRLHATAIEAADVAALFALRPPGGAVLDRFLRAEPDGRLEGVDVAAVARGDADWWWSAAGTLRNGRLAPVAGAPGVDGLGLRLQATADGGSAWLDSRSLRAVLPSGVRAPVVLDRLEGEVAWRREPNGGWVVESPGLQAGNPDLRTRTRFRLELPPDGRAAIDLVSEFRDGVLTRVPAYLPVGVMEPDAIKWLDAAFHGGRLATGRAVVRGPLADFPFDETRTGQFEVTASVEEVDLELAPGWPRLGDLDAKVRFQGDSLEVQADHGRMFDTNVLEATARIDSLSRETPVRVQGTVAGPLNDTLRLVRESPLSLDFGDLLDGVDAAGDSRLALDLSIAVDGVGRDRAKGTLGLEDARITHPALPLPVAALRGSVGFDDAGLKATGVAARLGELPVAIDLATAKDGATKATLRTGKTDLGALAPLLAKPNWAKGATAFTATLSLPPLDKPGPVGLRIESDLAGLALDLPPPLAKAAEPRRPLDLEVGFPDDRPLPVRLRYGADVDVALLVDRDAGAATRGELRFGGEKAQLPDTDQLRLRGRLAALDLPGLADWLQRHPERIPLPLDIGLTIDRLQLGDDGTLTAVQLGAREGRAGWQGEVQATELEGRFSVPAAIESGTAVVDLQRLDLRTGDPDARTPEAPAPLSRQDPRALPGLALTAAKLRLNGRDLGTLRATVARGGRGLDLTELLVDGPAGRLTATGSWHQEGQGATTRFRYHFETPDFGHVVITLGFADMIDRGPATLEGEHVWPGAPYDFARGRGTGTLALNMGAGRFIDVDPGVGRLMGLLNITALQRRLTLDFRDLFQKGLGFDTVTGNFDLRDGSLYTQDLTIKSPSSLIEISGRTGVLARDYDQVVSVTPSLQSALPIAGVVAGGPAVGAAMLVVQGLIGKQFDKIGRVRYSVRGSWDDPKVERLDGPAGGEPTPAPVPDQPPSGSAPKPGARPEPPVEKPAPAPIRETTPVPAFH